MLELGHKIGRGGFSDVYQARHKETRAMYACKVFRHIPYRLLAADRATSAQNATLTALIAREIDVLKRTRHENIVSYFGCLASPDTCHLALLMELCDGGSVKDLLLQSTEKLREAHIAYIVRSVLLALQHLHSTGIVHRDVKCANILLTTHMQVKLADFGVASKQYGQLDATITTQHQDTATAAPTQSPTTSSAYQPASSPAVVPSSSDLLTSSTSDSSFTSPPSPSSALTSSGSSCPSSVSTPRSQLTSPMGGTPLWMSPESLCGADPADSGDVWALGITCVEMAEGAPPHARLHHLAEIRAVVSALPPPSLASHAPSFGAASDEFSDFVSQCLRKEPTERATISQLLQHPFITRLAPDTPALSVASSPNTLTGAGLSRGAPRHMQLSPRQSPLPTPVASPTAADPPLCLLSIPVPTRTQSCPSPLPRQSVSLRPRSFASYPDRDFQHFILYGYYPVDSEWWVEEDGSEPASHRKHSTPSPVPPVSPSAASTFVSSVTHAWRDGGRGAHCRSEHVASRSSSHQPLKDTAHPPTHPLRPARTACTPAPALSTRPRHSLHTSSLAITSARGASYVQQSYARSSLTRGVTFSISRPFATAFASLVRVVVFSPLLLSLARHSPTEAAIAARPQEDVPVHRQTHGRQQVGSGRRREAATHHHLTTLTSLTTLASPTPLTPLRRRQHSASGTHASSRGHSKHCTLTLP